MKKRIAIIAHDGMKPSMVNFVESHKAILENMEIVATGTTGGLIERTGLKVDKKLSGPLGGDAQIAAMAAEGTLEGILFFKDPLGKHPHEPDIQMLLRVCDVHNVPLATNLATAEFVLVGLSK